MPHIAVITNRGSTRNLRGDNWIDPLLEGESDVVHFTVDRAEQIAEAVERCAAVGAEVIIVNGGDGTAGLVFAALLNGDAYAAPPALALLPAGKTNMTTAGWSLTGTPEQALAAVLRGRREGTLARHVVTRPVLALRRDEHAPPLYGAFFGAAEVVEGIRFCRRHIYPLKMPNTISHALAVLVLLWRGLSTAASRGAVMVQENDRTAERGNFYLIAVTTLNELLLGIRPVPAETEKTTGALQYLSLRLGTWPILGTFVELIHRRFSSGAGRTVRRMERLTLYFTGAYTLDGEIYEAHADQPIVLDGSRQLNFIRIPA